MGHQHAKHTRASLIRAIRKHADSTNAPITLYSFWHAAKVSANTIYTHFPQGFGQLIAAAKLQHRRPRRISVASDVLLADFHRIAKLIGHTPSASDLYRLGARCHITYYNRFGRAAGLRAAYFKWCKSNRITPFPPPPRGAAANAGNPEARPYKPGSSPDFWLAEPINFRGLSCHPTTEAGVIHLFGLLAPECGLVVEHIGSAFPDCRALKREPGNRWRRIAVEFEYRASNFKAHGHDASRCDMIVCWENDWKDCPIKVVDLKGMMEKAMGKS